VLEIVLTREDANTEAALLAEWLVEDRAEVSAGQPVCVVETTKATGRSSPPAPGRSFSSTPRTSRSSWAR
jgi:pyruvate/2-oxoglutarate dehydrogenase complex dihydrolipoamide acyltransferase (E2) component